MMWLWIPVHTYFWSQLLVFSLLLLSFALTLIDVYGSLTLYGKKKKESRKLGGSGWSENLTSFGPSFTDWRSRFVNILRWIFDLKSRWKGQASTASLAVFIPCVVIMLLGSLVIPAEHAAVLNQVMTTGPLYLPHVEQSMDQYHFYADPDGDSSRRMLLTFCQDKGFKPEWDEGQTLRWIRYKAWPDCLELIGVAGERDANGKLIQR
jgi:hypothetical protein